MSSNVRLVIPAKEAVIKLRAHTFMVVIPAQAGIHCTRSTAGPGQARSWKLQAESETCSTVDPGLRRDDVASILRTTHLSEPRGTANTNWITGSFAGATIGVERQFA